MEGKMPLKGAGLVSEGPKDPTSMRNEAVQTVSSESASLREPVSGEAKMTATPLKVMGK